MSPREPVEVHIDDLVQLRRPHPCGGADWLVVRVGADIGLRCRKCGHRIMLARSVFERRITRFLRRATRAEPPMDLDVPDEA